MAKQASEEREKLTDTKHEDAPTQEPEVAPLETKSEDDIGEVQTYCAESARNVVPLVLRLRTKSRQKRSSRQSHLSRAAQPLLHLSWMLQAQ